VPESSRIVVCAGPRACERRLLAELEAALPAGEMPGHGALVVVPSAALRTHLQGRLLDRRPGWLGLRVTTLAALADSILARAGGRPAVAGPLEQLLAARLAAREGALARDLGGLVGGFEEVAGAVRDLLDAGFVEAHEEALLERLEAERESSGAAPVERACAIVRVATALRRALAAQGLAPDADRLAAASAAVAADPRRALGGAAVFVHGFADATGAASDLLEAIVRHSPACVVLDAPPELDGSSRDWRFGARLRERLTRIAAIESDPEAPPVGARASIRTADPARQARSAARWVAQHEAAIAGESIAVVLRRTEGAVGRFVTAFDRASLPLSASAGESGPGSRLLDALLELLDEREECPLGVALLLAAAAVESASGRTTAELRLGFASLGARTLGAALGLDFEGGDLRLPLAARFEPRPGEGPPRTRLRSLPEGALERARGALRELARALPARSGAAPVAARAQALLRLLRALSPSESAEHLARQLLDLASGPCGPVEVDDGEWRQLLEAALRPATTTPLGAGGGVALLSATEARGLTFTALVIADLAEGSFPRPIRADPLLPDSLRLRLRDLLPDLPVKTEGHDEERFLFAQLLGAAPTVLLLRAASDEAGRDVSPSPLLEELWRHGLGERPESSGDEPPCALEEAVAAALAGDGPGVLERVLPAALREGRLRCGDDGGPDADAVAKLRCAGLEAREADAGGSGEPRHAGLGPYFGQLPSGRIDFTSLRPSVTVLERFAGCGWQVLLERVLRLQPLPEVIDGLPSLPRALTGRVVHAVLEGLFPAAERSSSLEEALARSEPVAAPWPGPEELERRTRLAARLELERELLDPALFEAPLVLTALGLLEVARAVDWPSGTRSLLGVELGGAAVIRSAGSERTLPFRVDRLERDDGTVVMTDYKTGGALSDGKKPETRRKHLAARAASGAALQLPVYLLALPGVAARARYLHLAPDLDERVRDLSLDAGELAQLNLDATFDALFAAWDRGLFLPRLLDPKKLADPWPGCAWCAVREACVQGDSASRLRMERWARATPPATEPDNQARAWWALAAAGAPGEKR